MDPLPRTGAGSVLMGATVSDGRCRVEGVDGRDGGGGRHRRAAVRKGRFHGGRDGVEPPCCAARRQSDSRYRARIPDRDSFLMPMGSSMRMNASTFSLRPVISTM